MFSSLQQTGDLIYHEIPSSLIFVENQQDLVVNLHDHVNLAARKRLRDQSMSPKLNHASAAEGIEDRKNENMVRKLFHRELEKKRRKDQSKLYASLGALLPPDFIKGKRSTSECIHQATNYIKHMQEMIEELSVKRDQIKKFGDMSVKERLLDVIPNEVSISSCSDRSFVILINSCLIEDGFLLSQILKALIEEGLDVINYTSKIVNKRIIHFIQSEANDTKLTDLTMLQQRLTAIANNGQVFN